MTLNTLAGAPAPALPIPRSPEVKRWLYDNAPMGETARFLELDRYERHYQFSQYDHLKLDWWGQDADAMETVSPSIQVPYGWEQPAAGLSVRQMRPTAPINLCRAIVDRFTGLVLSEVRKPDILVENDPDTEDYLLGIVEQTAFWASWRQTRNMGGSVGSALVTAHLRPGDDNAGEFSLESHNAKHIAAIAWKDREKFIPSGILKMYQYPRLVETVDPKTSRTTGTEAVMYLYRRIITEQEDIVYQPVKVEPGMQLFWEDSDENAHDVIQSKVEHGLGFFPGVWVQNLPDYENEDGEPDCQGAWQIFDTIDRLYSQVNKSILLNLDPTPVLQMDPKLAPAALRKGSDNAIITGQGGDAKYMEMNGQSIETAMKFAGQLRQDALHLVRCVLLDPEKMSGSAQSAKAIEDIYAPMLEKADDLRAQYGSAIVRLCKILIRMARALDGKISYGETGQQYQAKISLPPKLVVVPLADDAPPDAEPERRVEDRKLGPGGNIKLSWGPYFSPTENDRETSVRTIVNAKTGFVMDEETAVKQVARTFGIRDHQAMLHKIRKEQDEQTRKAMEESGMGGDGGVVVDGPVNLTATATGTIVTVDEARQQIGLPPLMREDGTPDPDGNLTIIEFQAKHSIVVAKAVSAEAGEAGGGGGAAAPGAPGQRPPAPKLKGGGTPGAFGKPKNAPQQPQPAPSGDQDEKPSPPAGQGGKP